MKAFPKKNRYDRPKQRGTKKFDLRGTKLPTPSKFDKIGKGVVGWNNPTEIIRKIPWQKPLIPKPPITTTWN